MTIFQLDHLVLTVQSLDKAVDFYSHVLGMQLEKFTPPAGGGERLALIFGNQKINLHDAAAPFRPHAQTPTPGALDLCFLSDLPLKEWINRLAGSGVAIEGGPVERTGASGPLLSIYIRDPDGNLIEISNLQNLATK